MLDTLICTVGPSIVYDLSIIPWGDLENPSMGKPGSYFISITTTLAPYLVGIHALSPYKPVQMESMANKEESGDTGGDNSSNPDNSAYQIEDGSV